MKLRTILALAGIWIIVGAVIYFAKTSKPTPEKINAYIASHPIQATTPEQDREKILETITRQLNRLSYDQRQQLQRSGNLARFFQNLTAEEKTQFLKKTLPQGFKQMMDAINKMTPEKRKRLVQRALEDMDKEEGGKERPPDGLSEDQRKLIIQQGVSSFYEDASAETKLDVTPLLERMQQITQNLR